MRIRGKLSASHVLDISHIQHQRSQLKLHEAVYGKITFTDGTLQAEKCEHAARRSSQQLLYRLEIVLSRTMQSLP